MPSTRYGRRTVRWCAPPPPSTPRTATSARRNTLVNDVMDDAARDRLVETVSGLLAGLRRDEVRQRAFDYWRAIDKVVGDRIEAAALAKHRA